MILVDFLLGENRVPLIGAQRQKFVDQIPFGPHHLYKQSAL